MTLFYENFERMRNKKKMSTKDVARYLDYGEKSLYAWENKKAAPSEEILLKLADLFGCKVSDFFKDEGERTYHDELVSYERLRSEADNTLDEFEQYLIDLYGKLGTKDKTAFMQMAYEFAEDRGVEL